MELKSGGIKDKHMSMADEIFINMCRDILENGTSTEGEKVRPHWPDGTSAGSPGGAGDDSVLKDGAV